MHQIDNTFIIMFVSSIKSGIRCTVTVCWCYYHYSAIGTGGAGVLVILAIFCCGCYYYYYYWKYIMRNCISCLVHWLKSDIYAQIIFTNFVLIHLPRSGGSIPRSSLSKSFQTIGGTFCKFYIRTKSNLKTSSQ